MAENKCGGSVSYYACWKEKKSWEKKKKRVEKYAKKSFKVLLVEERVQNIEFGPNYCLNLPFVLKVDYCNLSEF